METVKRAPYVKMLDWVCTPYDVLRSVDERKHPMLLESGSDHAELGRYSIVCADPVLIFESSGRHVEIQRDSTVEKNDCDPLESLRSLLKQYQSEYRGSLPFYGGAIGYFSYDLKNQIENLPSCASRDIEIPDIWLGFYHWAFIFDHLENTLWLTVSEWAEDSVALAEEISSYVGCRLQSARDIQLVARKTAPVIESNMTKAVYIQSIERVREYIRQGDIYQANFTQRFHCAMEGSALDLFGKIRTVNPAPFSAYLDIGEFQVVSASPERFIKVTDRIIETRPIKGTRPRGKNEAEDAVNRQELIDSEKDHAELLMIVDLERNDLGRVAEPGTVKVLELFKLETYATVFHLVSTITARLKDGLDIVDCLRATFPGGSITGAPKIRAMEIIDELEPTARNLYTGSVGYIGFNGDTDLNIVIRTILCKEGHAWFQTGGGIVWDSDPELEYEECLHKAKGQVRALSL